MKKYVKGGGDQIKFKKVEMPVFNGEDSDE